MPQILSWMLLGTAAAAALMLVLWLIHFAIRNASIVDPGWAACLALIAVIYALKGEGYSQRTWLLTAMVVIWGLRLSLYLLFTRVIGHPEEGRYVELRRKWGSNIGLKFLVFFEAQALLAGILSLPFALVMRDAAPGLWWFEYTGAALWVIAFLGETFADFQLLGFKRNPANKGQVCNVGLWRYSRHPNYFFEWLIWMAYAVYAFPSPLGPLALLMPITMLFFLFKLTGIPATEEQSIRSRGDKYRAYQRTTSAFVPWFPRRGSQEGLPKKV
jgi:steroid 5-alpha reductase family enzyme